MTLPHLRVRDLSKTFTLHVLGGKRVLGFADVGFDVPRGSFVGIAGPSGSGKSSLLKSMYRTYLVDSGTLDYFAADSTRVDLASASDDAILDLRASEIGYVSQFLRPIPRVRALDLAARPLLRRGVPLDEARGRVAVFFERLRLPRGLWDAYPVLFSGGEQQRVNIARALASEPRLLLLDEPTSSLDDSLQRVVVDLLGEARDSGSTLVGVMHDSTLLNELADRIVTMRDGRVVAA
jgi:alpha-D-ribose 1-methylphosphonate 5-triphosphate synthase subunit PhnL